MKEERKMVGMFRPMLSLLQKWMQSCSLLRAPACLSMESQVHPTSKSGPNDFMQKEKHMRNQYRVAAKALYLLQNSLAVVFTLSAYPFVQLLHGTCA